MEQTVKTIDSDIHVLCVQAIPFPQGITKAFATLEETVPAMQSRDHYGLSHGTAHGEIVYYAACKEEHPNEATELQLERKTISAGKYACILIPNFPQNLDKIPPAFQQLLTHPNLKPHGMCIEFYTCERGVECMVPLV